MQTELKIRFPNEELKELFLSFVWENECTFNDSTVDINQESYITRATDGTLEIKRYRDL